MSEARRMLLLFVAVAAGLLLVQAGQVTVSDGTSMMEVSKSIVNEQDLTVPEAYGVPGRNGEYYSKYGLGLPALAALPYALVKPVTAVVGHDRETASFATASVMPIAAAGIVLLAYLLGRRIGGSSRSALVVAIGTVLGTFLLPYSKDFFSEPLVCLALLACFLFTQSGRYELAALALGYGCLTRPQTLLLVPVFLVLLWSSDRRRTLRAAAIIVGFVGVMALYNFARYGDALQFGYPGEGFTGNAATAGKGLLLGSTKSVFLFAPCVVLLPAALARLWPRARTLCVLMTANLVIVFSTNLFWHDWRGGWSWGPRLLLTGIVPALPALAPWIDGVRARLLAVVGLFAVGFVVSFATVLVPTQAQQLDHRAEPRDAPAVLRQYALIGPTARYTIDNLHDKAEPGSGSHRRYLSLWQVNMARALGRAGMLGSAFLTMLLAALGAFAAWRFVATTDRRLPGPRSDGPTDRPEPVPPRSEEIDGGGGRN